MTVYGLSLLNYSTGTYGAAVQVQGITANDHDVKTRCGVTELFVSYPEKLKIEYHNGAQPCSLALLVSTVACTGTMAYRYKGRERER
jgi:hypothetical protein